MKADKLLNALFESSSLREDLLKDIKTIIEDMFVNVELTDELCDIVSLKTLNFIKEIKSTK